VLLLGISTAWAQYSGPALLTRGEAPAAISIPDIRFRPFVQVAGVYDTGLAGVTVANESGQLAETASAGVQLVFGISGSHAWRHTKVGLGYQGNISHYAQRSYYDGFNQSLSLSVNHEFTRHATFNLSESAGMFSRNFGLTGLQSTVAFDPATANIPVTDFFDNRTIYSTTQAAFILQKTSRLSFRLGGDSALIFRRSSALYSTHLYEARGDIQYRLTKRTTVGPFYSYAKMGYSRVFGGTDAHTFAGSYSIRINRTVEFSAYAGVVRYESSFLQTTAIDPAIAALLGVTQNVQLYYALRSSPTVDARISKALRRGVLFANGGRTLMPGNGLFLTTEMTTIGGGYAYNGLRRWSASVQGMYARGDAFGNVSGVYGNMSAGLSLARSLGHAMHLAISYQARKYDSPNYANYNRVIHQASVSLAFSPGETPLRLW